MTGPSVYFVSDSTGITAETFGKAILAQFEIATNHIRVPFINTIDKAYQIIHQINHVGEIEGRRPIVFVTLANTEVLELIKLECKCVLLDMFSTFIEPLEREFATKSNHRIGRFSDISKSEQYNRRIEAINYSLSHDDGQSHADLASAEIILIGVSRSGKTPTSLYLAMQHSVKVANYPLIPDDFERNQLPAVIRTHHKKVFGLTISAMRLSDVRNTRRPGSVYSSLDNCRYEVSSAENMMRRADIPWLSTTTLSIEEIATNILQQIRPECLR